MPFHKAKLKLLITTLFEMLKNLDTEIMAHRVWVQELSKANPEFAATVQSVITAVRNNPVIAEEMRKKWEVPLAELLREADQVPSDQVLEELLRFCKSTDQVN